MPKSPNKKNQYTIISASTLYSSALRLGKPIQNPPDHTKAVYPSVSSFIFYTKGPRHATEDI